MSAVREVSIRRRRWAVPVAVLTAVALVLPIGAAAQAAPGVAAARAAIEPGDLSGVPVEPDGEAITGAKALTSRVAESDPALLGRSDATPIPVMIKLDYDPVATYDGSLRGLQATSPSVTDRPLTDVIASSSPYANHIERVEGETLAAIEAAVPAIEVTASFRVVFGGVAAVLPANQVDALLEVPGVVAVQADELNELLTDSTPSFIGADGVWPGLGGQASAGNGVLFGSLDSGVWPEHPSFADLGTTPPRPNRPDQTPLECTFGDNPLTPEADPFTCNDKLVGGRAFMAGYNAQVGDDLYVDSARDSNGHGTHTATTAAGNIADASIDSEAWGQVSGVAPGAWVMAYKVCGPAGCYSSDSALAVEAAILDGVDVINFSISGGTNPAVDPVELAFLDAYAAGVFVAASAGNSGPGAATVAHLGPWTTTVAASTPPRSFRATVDYTANGVPGSVTGVSIGVGTGPAALPVVLGSAAPYGSAGCTTPAAAGTLAGKIVVCDPGGSRVRKSYNVAQGGAAGMIVGATSISTLGADGHWVPTVHLDPISTATLKSALATGETTGSLSAGASVAIDGDEIAVFSSRGPRGIVMKPDLAAPGVEILAGITPTPEAINLGPPGRYFQPFNGTSMAAPHVAGAALLMGAQHPTWSPGAIRSALMTTALADLTTQEDGAAATSEDQGAGRIRIDRAGAPGLVLDETATRFAGLGLDPLQSVHLNLPSVYAPIMPGKVVTTRTFTNTGGAASYTVATQAQSGSSITVEPASFTVAAGATQEVEITITTSNDDGPWEFGAIVLASSGRPDVRIPVAFDPAPGDVRLTALGCDPDTIDALEASTCSYEVENVSFNATTVDLEASGGPVAAVTGADLGAVTSGGRTRAENVPLAGRSLGVPSVVVAGSPFGFIALSGFGVNPTAVGDETIVNLNVPPFVFNDVTYTRVGITSNGYLVAGGGTAADLNCCDLTEIGDSLRPNNLMAPFWTDLDGTGATGFRAATLSSGPQAWLVIEWDLFVAGTTSRRVFQAWIGLNGTQDVSFAYPAGNLPAIPSGQDVLIGAENELGEGIGLPKNTPVTGDLRIVSTPAGPGVTQTWNVEVRGTTAGTQSVVAGVSSPLLPGTDLAAADLTVEALPLPTVTLDPVDQSVVARDTASFTASASGGTITRWEVSSDDGDSWSTVDGATTGTLSFTARGDQDGDRFRAVFANATNDEVATDAAVLSVAQIETETSVTASPASPVRGQEVTFTAEVEPATASGTVQFTVDGSPLGAPVTLADGLAVSGATSSLAVGEREIGATYLGDVDHAGSTGTTEVVVIKAGTATSVVSIEPDPIVVGDDITVTVSVDPRPTGGNIQLQLDGVDAGDPASLDEAGEATLTLTGLDPGTYELTAVFSGDDDLSSSTSSSGSVTVGKRQTTTSVVSVAPVPVVVGDDTTVSVAVAPTPIAGSVQLALDGVDAGVATAVGGSGTADITLSGIAPAPTSSRHVLRGWRASELHLRALLADRGRRQLGVRPSCVPAGPRPVRRPCWCSVLDRPPRPWVRSCDLPAGTGDLRRRAPPRGAPDLPAGARTTRRSSWPHLLDQPTVGWVDRRTAGGRTHELCGGLPQGRRDAQRVRRAALRGAAGPLG
jgi:subtilisin family serine protease